MKNNFKIVIAACAFGIIGLWSHNANAISPLKEVTLYGNELTVGDVFSDLKGQFEYADHVLAKAPRLGKTMVLSSRDLNRIAVAFDLPWRSSNNMDTTKIKLASTIITTDDINRHLEAKIREEFSDSQYQLELSNSRRDFVFPGNIKPKIEISNFKFDEYRGAFNAVVNIYTDNKSRPTQQDIVTGKLYRVISVPVLINRAHNGDIIRAFDIDYIQVRANKVSHNTITNPEKLIGKTPRRSLSEMRPIQEGDIHEPLIVSKGDTVTIILKHNKINLTAQGRAMDNGAKGDTVRVMNASSRQIIEATVSGYQKVNVETTL